MGHTFDLSCTSLLVQSLRITLFDNVKRSIDKDFDEAEAGLLVQLTRDGTVSSVG